MLNFDADCDGHGDGDNTSKQAFNCKVSGIQWFKITFYWKTVMPSEARFKQIGLDMFVKMSNFQNQLSHTHFNMLVDEC